MSTALATTNSLTAIEQVLVGGNLSTLTTEQRLSYYQQLCKSLGLNHLTQPFEYITLNGKMKLYAKKDCTDQLRSLKGVSVEKIEKERIEDVYAVTAYVKNAEGRTDSAIGAVPIANLKGEALANALMKAETKAKRRATLSICGLGFLDELEIETITQPLIDGAAKAPHVAHHQDGQADEVVEGVVEEIKTMDKGTFYKIADKVCFTEDPTIIGKLAGAHGLKVELLTHEFKAKDKTFQKINNVIGIEVEPEDLTPLLAASIQEVEAKKKSAFRKLPSAEDLGSHLVLETPEPDPYFAEIDGKLRVSGTATDVWEKGKTLFVKMGDEVLSCFVTRSMAIPLRTAKGQRVILDYALTTDGKYKNITDLKRIGDREYFEGKPMQTEAEMFS